MNNEGARMPFKPEFFFRLSFAATKVAYITAMIFFTLPLLCLIFQSSFLKSSRNELVHPRYPTWQLFVNHDVIPLHVMSSPYFGDPDEKLLDLLYTI